MTVLFADLKGSMDLGEKAIRRSGIGMMAIFGAPIAHEDHAQRACYAALSLQ